MNIMGKKQAIFNYIQQTITEQSFSLLNKSGDLIFRPGQYINFLNQQQQIINSLDESKINMIENLMLVLPNMLITDTGDMIELPPATFYFHNNKIVLVRHK